MVPERSGINNQSKKRKFIIISGTVIEGVKFTSGIAANCPFPSGTLSMQTPFFKQKGLDLNENFQATLNVSIKPRTCTLINPEFTFPNVKWYPDHDPDTFSFSRCSIIFEELTIDAFAYFHHPKNREGQFWKDSVIEIIAPYLPGLRYGQTVQLELNPEEIKINYV